MLVGMSNSPAKFWAPMSLWKVLLVFLITNVVMLLIGVALREGLGFAFMTPAGAAAGGGAGAVLIVGALATKHKQTAPPP
jgi:hypothetical protein